MTWVKCSIIDEDVNWFIEKISELGAQNIETEQE